MSQEIVEAVREIEREKGIDAGQLLVARSRTRCSPPTRRRPGASRHATVELDDAGDYRVFAIELPEDLERAAARRGARARARRARADRGGDGREEPHAAHRRRPRRRLVAGARRADEARGRHPRQLRPHRRADRQAGDPAADPRGRARDDVRRVHRPRQRGRHRDRPAGRRPQQRPRRPRQGRGAPAALRAGRRRALRAGLAHQGRDHRGPHRHEGPAGDPLAPRSGADQDAVRARGARDRRRPRRRSRASPASRATARRSRSQSHAQGVDPVGACVGPRGSRVRMVVSELRGEKIDIIPWNQEPARFVAKALSPARVREVYLDDAGKEATVVVPDDQLALAIGKEGMNARLAHRLTGWKIDIVSDTEFAQQEAEAAFGGDGGEEGDFSGRCSAVLSNGKRCPNAALPGSKYCGVPAHQELALHEPDDEVEPDRPGVRARARGARRHGRARGGHRGRGRVRRTPSPRSSRPGPATRRSTARTRRSSRARSRPVRVEDDPDDGIPIAARARRAGPRDRGGGERRLSPIRTCAGCGRKAPQGELQRFHAARTACSSPGSGPAAASTRAAGSPVSSAPAPIAASIEP